MEQNNADVIATNEWYAKQIREVGEYLIKHANEFASGPDRGCMEFKINIYAHGYSPEIEMTTTHVVKGPQYLVKGG